MPELDLFSAGASVSFARNGWVHHYRRTLTLLAVLLFMQTRIRGASYVSTHVPPC